MKLCNDVITVFNARVDPQTGDNVWIPTVIRGASWFCTDASTVDAVRGGLAAANRVTVRIPEEVMPEGLAIRNGDIIVRGDAGEAEPRPAKLKAAFPESITVLAVTDNLRRDRACAGHRIAPRAPHLKVVGA